MNREIEPQGEVIELKSIEGGGTEKGRGRGTGQGNGESEAGEEWAERGEEENRDQTGTERSRKTRGGDSMAITWARITRHGSPVLPA